MLSSLFVSCLFLITMGHGTQVKFDTPNEKTSWSTRSDVMVVWSVADLGSSSPKKIDIDLMLGPDDGVLIDNISFGVPIALGGSEWIVDKYLSSRDDYFVRITSPEDPKFKFISPRFKIERNMTAALGNSGFHGMASNQGIILAILIGFLIVFI